MVASQGLQAQTVVLGPNPVVGGQLLSCPGTVTHVAPINDLALARPGLIVLSPQLFSMPPVVQIFVYAHECGHQIYGSNEADADCWAIKTGRDQGWLPAYATEAVARSVADSPGSWTHAPGPVRIAHMAYCYNTP